MCYQAGRKRKRLKERERATHSQTNINLNSFEGLKTSERWSGAHTSFPERVDATLDGTELVVTFTDRA